MQVASAHSILEQMNTQINEMLRNKVLSALKNAIKEFKQCKVCLYFQQTNLFVQLIFLQGTKK